MANGQCVSGEASVPRALVDAGIVPLSIASGLAFFYEFSCSPGYSPSFVIGSFRSKNPNEKLRNAFCPKKTI
jgi:hypothetical protein